jgi:hypothetical protein
MHLQWLQLNPHFPASPQVDRTVMMELGKLPSARKLGRAFEEYDTQGNGKVRTGAPPAAMQNDPQVGFLVRVGWAWLGR